MLMPAPSALIRPVADADGQSVAALIAACFAEYPGCLFSWDEFPELRAPASWAAGRGTRMWVLDGHGAAIDGCICATPDGQGAMELHKFYLASALRGSGLAQELAGLVFERAHETGAQSIFLWTDTRFTRAHRFYEKLSFARQPQTRLLGDISDTTEFLYTLPLVTST
ncbi:MAG: GNAT family N-acetyltransferase [Hyphomicrobiales bacterium]|nr:GNAT family N-acetyltransferase [Hyphomicrobiales bacterium]